MTPNEYMIQLQEVLNLMYSTLETIQATAETMLDAVATERAALDTLAAPAFSSSCHHQTVTRKAAWEIPQTVGALGFPGETGV